MNPFILQMVNHKLNTIKKDELIQLAKQYQFKITENQAQKIIAILRSETIDVTNLAQRERILAKVKQQVDAKTEKKMNEMLKQYDQYL
jgi:mannitol-1-phosphate/altronate dehydrogenase